MKNHLYLPLFIHSGRRSFPSTHPHFADFALVISTFQKATSPSHVHISSMLRVHLCIPSRRCSQASQQTAASFPSFLMWVTSSLCWELVAGSSLYARLVCQLHEGRVQSESPLSLWHQAQCLVYSGCPVKGPRGLKKEVIGRGLAFPWLQKPERRIRNGSGMEGQACGFLFPHSVCRLGSPGATVP